MLEQFLFQLGLGSLISYAPWMIGFGVLYLYLQQRNRQYIHPLDLADARKLDDTVSQKVKESIRPLLQSQGYDTAQIQEILTRTSRDKCDR